METWVSHVDCTQCIGRVSKEKGYCCPTIQDESDEHGASVDIKNIRHPLVEATSSRISYVKHDIKLGTKLGTNINTNKGWLVYGMNASGKSTLMKATGLCVLLAQAGCFVPAKEMTLKPFKAIYTRILNQDNLFAGLSSFAVEMSELRDILRNADKHTLVLGDELCAGTESISAQALVASGIQWLSARNAKFIFATHLHGLPNVIDTTVLGVEVWHLHVEYDPITKKLVYDRSLRPGNGSTLYGLEVARAMDLPFEFIEEALKNRRKIEGSTTQVEASSSKWNVDIVRKECEVCHKQMTSNLEVHHIKERASAGRHGILEDGTHMNDKRNLVVICQKCHDDVHAGKMDIGEVKLTSDGPERIIKTASIAQKKSKWSEEEHEIIVSTLRKYSILSLKSLEAHLSSKHDIRISVSVLGKMRKELAT
jgi:DNA mismatch repair protein MutS